MVSTLTDPMSSAAAAAAASATAIAPNSVAAVAPASVTAPASPFLSSRPLVSVYTGQSSMVGASSDQPPPSSPAAPPPTLGDPSYTGPWMGSATYAPHGAAPLPPAGPYGAVPIPAGSAAYGPYGAATGRRPSLPDRRPMAPTGPLLHQRATTGRRPTRPPRLHLLPLLQRRPTRLHLSPRTLGRTGPRRRHCPTAATTLRPWLHLVDHLT